MLESHKSSHPSIKHDSKRSYKRDSWLEIDLTAIESNVKTIRSWISPDCQLMAVVKSDAYGHGAEQLASLFEACGVNWLGVASVDEGLELRESGINLPILILSPCPTWAITSLIQNNLCFTITSLSQIKDLSYAASKLEKKAQVQLKIDTGMHRLGLRADQAHEAFNLISGDDNLHLVGLFSHLAIASDKNTVHWQNDTFDKLLKELSKSYTLPPLIHLASSTATKCFPETHYNMVRVGLYLYGLEANEISKVLIPAMSVRARINHLQEVQAGESVSYGLTWTASRPSRLASIPIGYGDGVNRNLSNLMSALLLGKEIKQVGLISMDQMLFDITDVKEATIGDVITLIGQDVYSNGGSTDKQLYLANWASMLNTITYELACNLRVRLPRIYTRHKTQQVSI